MNFAIKIMKLPEFRKLHYFRLKKNLKNLPKKY